MDELRVHKDRVEATVYCRNEIKISGEFFLSSYSHAHQGHETLSDLLEEENYFIPLVISKGNQTELINKNNIVMLESNFKSSDDGSIDEKITMGLIRAYEVKVIFEDGESVTGTILSEVQLERARLSDCLNLPCKFLRFRLGARFLHLNKGWISRVISLEK